MSAIPPARPAISGDVARQVAFRLIHEGAAEHSHAIIAACPVIILASRGAGDENRYGRYDDPIVLITPDAVEAYNGNTDPGRTGLNEGIDKFFARLEPGVWPMIRGHHNGVPKRFRQPNSAQAKALGLDRFFEDHRGRGHYTVRRMANATDGILDVGIFNINLHPGSMTRTGSAGCQTLPPDQYVEMRDIAYAALDAAGQTWVPYVLTDERIA